MSWLRDHFYRFVYPALAAARLEKNPRSMDIEKHFPVAIPEVPEDKWTNLPSELRKLKALDESLKAQKKSKPSFDSSSYVWSYDNEKWTPNSRGKVHFDLIREALLSAESTRKALGCSKLLFAGRDVWAFEIMAQKRGIPSLFMPEISRKVVQNKEALAALVKQYGFTGEELLVDTGFAGSIPRNMNEKLGCNLKFILLSQDSIMSFMGPKSDVGGHVGIGLPFTRHKEDERALLRPNQIFPNRSNVRGEALEIEYLPKYWASGTIDNIYMMPNSDVFDRPLASVIQYLSSPDEIVAAAFMTSNIWRGVKYGRNENGSYKSAPPKEERRPRKKKHSFLW